MGNHQGDPFISSIGSPADRAGLSGAAQHRQLENRLQQVRPADLTRAQETQLEPDEPGDHLDIPFEQEVEGVVPADGNEPGAAADVEGLEADAEWTVDAERNADAEWNADAGWNADAEWNAGAAAEEPVADMQTEMEEVRRSFEPTLAAAPNSVLRPGGLFTTSSGLEADTIRPFGDRSATPTDGYCGRGGGWGVMTAAMLGMSALSAFSPFMFGMPFMTNPMGFGMFNSMNYMFTPMMSSLSLSMMSMANMAMTPPLMGCMPYAFGSMPYPFPMMNPYTMPPGMGIPPYGMPGSPTPGYGAPGYDAPPPAPHGVVARVGNDGPAQSTLQNGAVAELSESQQARLSTLAPERQQAFQQLWDRYKGADLALPGRAERVRVNDALGTLLESGKLDVKDREGNDLLGNLSQMSAQPMGAGLDGSLLTAQAIVHTAEPAHTMTQGNRGTCAAATVEYMLARKNPAEFVRVARGLTGPQGAAELASGKPVVRVPDSVPEDNSGRTALNRVMQAAFMNAEGMTTGAGQYTNLGDRFQSLHAPGWNPFQFFGQPQSEQGGLRPEQVQDLASHAMGENYVEVFREGQDPYQALPLIDHAARAPGSDGVPVSMQWDGGRHRILVTSVQDGRVYFRNPWGERTTANADERLMGVDHQIGQDGIESLPAADFAARMKSAIVPQRLLG